jgi:hypothetical protein
LKTDKWGKKARREKLSMSIEFLSNRGFPREVRMKRLKFSSHFWLENLIT